MTDNRSSTTGAELPLAACHHAIVQSSLDCIITIDHLGNIIEFNPAAEHTFQLKKADVIGQSMVDLIVPPALRAAHRHGMKRFMQTGKSEVLGRRIELTAIRSDGTEFPVELAITPIDIDTENPVFTACLRDITDRVERERAKSRMQELQAISQEVVSGFLEKEDLVPTIKNMLQRLGEFFDASHAQILRIRDNGSRVYCTHEWCHVDGKPTIGCLQGFDAAHLDDRFPGVRNGKMAMDTGQVTPDDKQVPQAQDKVDFKATVAWPLRIEGEVELILLIADSRKLQAWSKEEISTVQLLSESLSRAIERRIAERKRVLAAQQIQDALQEAEKANAIKSDFLANMSHEIRTPLAAILGYVDLMRKQMGSDQSLVELFQVVESNGHHLDQLLCDLLDISRIEAGILPIEPRDCRLDQLLALICAEYDHRAQSAGLNFRFVSQGDIPRFVFADPVRLHQILANLLTNAVKYTNSGSIELAVSAESGHDDTAIIRFSVTDTGTGIPDEIRSVIFERFHQGPPHNDDTQRGVGLGLAIVRNMVDLLGGTIELQTVSGQGTTFDVEFPVRRAWDWQQVSRDSLRLAESSSQMSESGLRGAILIVDDSDDLLHLCKEHMTSWGLTCSTASSGAEAIERATSQPFDLIVIDWRMPGMTGLEATRKLRTLGVDIPIIALTAHAMAGAREACLDAGCDGYLPKPINFPQLRDIVSDLLGPQDGNVSESLSDESESILNDNSLAPITVRYLTTLAIECKQLRDAADEANWTLIRDIAHRIHGTAGSFTLRVISDLAEQLRRSCDVQSREQAMDIIVAMQQASESALMKISPE